MLRAYLRWYTITCDFPPRPLLSGSRDSIRLAGRPRFARARAMLSAQCFRYNAESCGRVGYGRAANELFWW